MHQESLPVFASNARFDIAMALPGVLDGGVELRDMLAFCQHFRIRGVASLLLNGAPELFRSELSKSGHAFAHYLARSGDDGKATSRAGPFFDAVAALDLECARDIARRSRMTWNSDRELEDDFLYVQFLMKRFFLDAPLEECEAILNRYKDVQAGEADVKHQLATSLLLRKEEDFHDALCAWLAQEEERYGGLVSSEAILPEEAATEASLSVEGLALMRLAEGLDFRLAEDYPMIPSIARSRAPIMFDPNGWKGARE